MQPPNHACRFEGITKTKLQGSEARDRETLQSQTRKSAENDPPISRLHVVHGRLDHPLLADVDAEDM